MSTEDGIAAAVTEVTERLGAPAIAITQADFHIGGFFAESPAPKTTSTPTAPT